MRPQSWAKLCPWSSVEKSRCQRCRCSLGRWELTKMTDRTSRTLSNSCPWSTWRLGTRVVRPRDKRKRKPLWMTTLRNVATRWVLNTQSSIIAWSQSQSSHWGPSSFLPSRRGKNSISGWLHLLTSARLNLCCPTWEPHVASEHASCGSSELRCVASVKCTPDFKDLVWKKDVQNCNHFFTLMANVKLYSGCINKVNFICFFLMWLLEYLKFHVCFALVLELYLLDSMNLNNSTSTLLSFSLQQAAFQRPRWQSQPHPRTLSAVALDSATPKATRPGLLP